MKIDRELPTKRQRRLQLGFASEPNPLGYRCTSFWHGICSAYMVNFQDAPFEMSRIPAWHGTRRSLPSFRRPHIGGGPTVRPRPLRPIRCRILTRRREAGARRLCFFGNRSMQLVSRKELTWAKYVLRCMGDAHSNCCSVCRGTAVAERLGMDGIKRPLCARHVWDEDCLRVSPVRPGHQDESYPLVSAWGPDASDFRDAGGWQRVISTVRGFLAL